MREISREQIVAFRCARHGLGGRLPFAAWRDALAVVPMQDSPPGASVPLMLAARVEEGGAPFAAVVADAWEAGGILCANAMRYAPLFCLPGDHAAISVGCAPDGPEGWNHRLQVMRKAIERAGMTCGDAAMAAVDCMGELLSGGPMPHDILCALLRRTLPPPLGDAMDGNAYLAPHLVLAASQTGLFLLRPRVGNQRVFCLNPAPPYDREAAGRALVRMFLRACAPASAREFAAFAGVAPFGHAAAIPRLERAWEDALAGCEQVAVGGKPKYVLREDMDELLSAPPPEGLRVLPTYDAWFRQEGRDLLLPSPAHRKIAFPAVAPPALILLDGRVAGTVRITKRPRALLCACDLFAPLSPRLRDDLGDALRAAARSRGFGDAEITITE